MNGTTGGIRRTLRESVRFQQDNVSVGAGLRSAAAVVLVLGVGLAWLGTTAGVTMGAGALVVGMGGRAAGLRLPSLTMAAISLAIGASTFAGSVTGRITWLHVLLLAAWGGGAGLMSALSPSAGVVGLQALVALVVFGRFPESPAGAGRLVGFVLAGGAAQVVVAAAVHLPPALARQRRAVASAYRLLADAARRAPDGSTLPAATALDEAEATMSSRGLFGRADVAALRSLLDEGRRIRVGLAGVARLGARRGLMEAVASVLDAVAAAVGDPDGARTTDAALAELAGRLSPEQGSAGFGPLSALAGQLRAAAGLAQRAAQIHTTFTVMSYRPRLPPGRALGRRLGERLDVARSALATLRANTTLRSPAGRHALRMAVMVPGAFLLAQHLPFQRGYWITLTAAVVLKADFATTFMRGIGRLAGTVAGATVAGLVSATVEPGQVTAVVLIGLLSIAGFAVFQAGYAAGIGFVSAVVVFLLDLVTPDSFSTATDRIIATLIGGTLALVVYRLWPTWSTEEVRADLLDLVASTRRYAYRVLRPGTPEASLREAARSTRLARTRADAAVERSLAEPARHQTDPARARGVIAELRRVVLATHLIRMEAAPESLPPGFAEGVDEALDRIECAISQGLRAGTGLDPSALPPLRALQEGIDRHNPVWEGTDELVDAIGTLASVVARPPRMA